MIDEQALQEVFAQFDQGAQEEAEARLMKMTRETDEDDPLLGQALLALSYAECAMGRYDAARETGLRLLSLWQGAPDESVALHHLAMTERMAKDYGAALEWLKKEQELLDASPSPDSALRRGANQYERGCVFLAQGEWETAKLLLESSLQIGGMTSDALLMGNAMRTLAEWHDAKGEKEEARQMALQASDLFAQAGENRAAAETLLWLEGMEEEAR